MRITTATSPSPPTPLVRHRQSQADAAFPDLQDLERVNQRDARQALRPTRRDTFGRTRERSAAARESARPRAAPTPEPTRMSDSPTSQEAAASSPPEVSAGTVEAKPSAPKPSTQGGEASLPSPAADLPPQPPVPLPPPTTQPAHLGNDSAPSAFAATRTPRAANQAHSPMMREAGPQVLAGAPRQASRAASAGARAAASVRLPSPIELRNHVIAQLKIKVTAATATAEIELDPPELGAVKLTMVQDDDGVRAVLQADHDAALQALQAYAREIEAVLRQAGVDLTSLDLRQGEQHPAQPQAAMPQPSGGQDRDEVAFDGGVVTHAVGLVDVIV